MNTSNTNRPTGRAKSCVVCRQFKLACDARKTAPDPCSRCVSKELKCRFDPNFKRISTRRIAQEVADELHTLRASQNADSSTSSTNTPQSQLTVGGQSPAPQAAGRLSVSSHSSFGGPHSDPNHSRWLDLAEDEVVNDQSLQGVSVSSSRILKLFFHFERYYYPHTRFLPQVKSINALSAKSPLLFCTILLLAAERYASQTERQDGMDHLYEQLCAAHEVLIAEVLHIAIQKLEVIHALILLCMWPVPKLRNAYDPSWNYIGLAIQAASSLDCHSPVAKNAVTAHYRAAADTAAAEMEPSNQAMTWLYCFQMSARLSAYLGLPPLIASPHSAKSLKRAIHLAKDVLTIEDHAQIKLLDLLCSAEIHLDNIEDCSAHFSLTQTFEAQLDNIRIEFQQNWSWNLEAQWQATKLFILGMTLTLETPPDHEQISQPFMYRQIALEKCMNAASSYITTMTDLSDQSVAGQRYASGILTFYPKHYFTTLMAAAANLFKFLIAYQGATESQKTLAMTRITQAHKIFQSFPDHRDATRACINIEHLVNAIKSPPAIGVPPTELAIKNRLGASVVSDALFRAAQQRNRHPFDGSNLPVAEWSTLNEDSAHRLPPAPEQKVASPNSQIWSNKHASPMVTQALDMPMDVTTMGIWDSYSNDFGILNEPWLGDDAEFATVSVPQQQMQMMYPAMAGAYDSNVYGGTVYGG